MTASLNDLGVSAKNRTQHSTLVERVRVFPASEKYGCGSNTRTPSEHPNPN